MWPCGCACPRANRCRRTSASVSLLVRITAPKPARSLSAYEGYSDWTSGRAPVTRVPAPRNTLPGCSGWGLARKCLPVNQRTPDQPDVVHHPAGQAHVARNGRALRRRVDHAERRDRRLRVHADGARHHVPRYRIPEEHRYVLGPGSQFGRLAEAEAGVGELRAECGADVRSRSTVAVRRSCRVFDSRPRGGAGINRPAADLERLRHGAVRGRAFDEDFRIRASGLGHRQRLSADGDRAGALAAGVIGRDRQADVVGADAVRVLEREP